VQQCQRPPCVQPQQRFLLQQEVQRPNPVPYTMSRQAGGDWSTTRRNWARLQPGADSLIDDSKGQLCDYLLSAIAMHNAFSP
jgi:hypothetical protein